MLTGSTDIPLASWLDTPSWLQATVHISIVSPKALVCIISNFSLLVSQLIRILIRALSLPLHYPHTIQSLLVVILSNHFMLHGVNNLL